MDNKEKENKKILKKMNREKAKKEKNVEKEKTAKSPKEHIASFFGKLKELCIKDTSRMILLVAILIAVYVVINLGVRQINLAQIDLTKDKRYTLTDQSKNIVRTIDKEMTFYVWGYSESDEIIDLLKQYNTENNKISYKLVTTDDAEEISKYGFENGYQEVVGVATDGRISYISGTDLYTYDDSYNVVDLTEQKITNAINNLSATKETKVYFVEGRTNYTTESGIYYLTQYLGNEYYEVGTINIMSDSTIPDDCDVLAIMGLSSDFTSQEADNICKYIEKGGDLIITNDIDYSNVNRDYPNFQRILDEYDISMPNKVVQENSDKNKVSGYNNLVFQANIASDHEITRLLYNYDASGTNKNGVSVKPLFLASGIIEMDSNKMLEDNITATSILMTSTQATVSDLATKTTEENSGNYYTIGAAIQKMVESGDESRLVVFSSTSSFSDNALDNQTPMVAYNANIIMNSFAFASNRGELYSIRKSSSYTKYTPTDREDKVVRVIIYAIPVAIIVLGMCVWLTRRKLK
jgi:ABC-2 type transport system permease protein